MKVLIMPTMRCNLDCEYCYLNSIETKDSVRSFRTDERKTVNEWFDGILWLEKTFGKIESVDISGGEPFIHPRMIDLIKYVINRWGRINITTNLLELPDDFYLLPPDKIGLTVSAHLNTDGEIRNMFKRTLWKLKYFGFHYNINFVAYPKQVKRFEKIKRLSESLLMSRHLEPYIDYNTKPIGFGVFETDDEKEYFLNNLTGYDKDAIAVAEERGTKIVDCDVAKNYMVVVENGDVYPCFGMMFEKRNKLANIFSREKYSEPVTMKCDIFCPCAANYRDGFR